MQLLPHFIVSYVILLTLFNNFRVNMLPNKFSLYKKQFQFYYKVLDRNYSIVLFYFVVFLLVLDFRMSNVNCGIFILFSAIVCYVHLEPNYFEELMMKLTVILILKLTLNSLNFVKIPSIIQTSTFIHAFHWKIRQISILFIRKTIFCSF